ncbi:MAG: cobalt ECF transporter T component CbiQ [Methanomicrobiales archaeon]|nr:cobalt ECF transporter T component CbiQ [Methanomicrobiales archaeon]
MFDVILEEYASSNRFTERDSRLKFTLGFGALLLVSISMSPLAPIFVAISMALIVILLAGIPARVYLSLLLLPSPFLVLSIVAILLITGGGNALTAIHLGPYTLHLSTGAIVIAINTAARILGGMSALLFVALTTPMVELFSLLKSLRLPQEFIDLSMLVYRCTFLMLAEAIAIQNAQTMRQGYSNFRNSIRSISLLGSGLFIRGWNRGEELLLAMDSRCYDGRFEMPLKGKRMGRVEISLVFAYLVICGFLALAPYIWGSG